MPWASGKSSPPLMVQGLAAPAASRAPAPAEEAAAAGDDDVRLIPIGHDSLPEALFGLLDEEIITTLSDAPLLVSTDTEKEAPIPEKVSPAPDTEAPAPENVSPTPETRSFRLRRRNSPGAEAVPPAPETQPQAPDTVSPGAGECSSGTGGTGNGTQRAIFR
jgi:hypothetical protein